MVQVKDYAAGDTMQPCYKCGKLVYGDKGYLLTNGKYICVAGDKCSMRVTKEQSKGKPIRWRKEG